MLQPSRPAGTFKLKVYYVGWYLPSLSSVCNGPLSLSLFLSFYLSLSFPYSLRFSSKKTGPLLLSLSLQVFKHTHRHTQKGEPYTTAISLSASQNILYI